MVQGPFRRLANNINRVRRDYPVQIWTLAGGSFINFFGGSMVFPLFSLYFTGKFGLTLAEAGLLSTVFVVGGIAGSVLGGYASDRLGRKSVMVFSLASAVVLSMVMGLTTSLEILVIDVLLFGFTVPMYQPASAAMIADLVLPERRAASYSLLRIAQNAGVALGPAVAAGMLALQRGPDGSLANDAYLPLFVGDAVTSLIFALIIVFGIKETRPETPPAENGADSPASASGGYGRIFRDSPFLIFAGLFAVIGVVYSQMNTTFGVYINSTFGVPQEHYGLMLASNAALVVLLQFSIARWADRHNRSIMLALGAVLYGIGFGLVGFVSLGLFFEIAIIIITFGEMVIVPVAQTVAADLAPVDMRGRYQAVFTLTTFVGFGIGPFLGGSLFDVGLGQWIWIASFIIALAVAAGYLVSRSMLGKRTAEA